MNKQKRNLFAKTNRSSLTNRRDVLGLLGIGLVMPLGACGQRERKLQNYTILGVEVFSCLDRAVGDIMFNGQDLGVMNKWGGTGLITGVRIPFGKQTLSWMLDGPEGTPRNGEIVTVKNNLMILPDDIPSGTKYVGLNIYPDFTAEITFSEELPERSSRGKQIKAARK